MNAYTWCALFQEHQADKILEQAQKIIVDLSEEAEIELPIEGVLRFQTQIWFQR
tara:strand:+ start:242 stop:403 length:162 start_codon:yes stop_codon:yes gene_type:complete